jgi:hypothetical protein
MLQQPSILAFVADIESKRLAGWCAGAQDIGSRRNCIHKKNSQTLKHWPKCVMGATENGSL